VSDKFWRDGPRLHCPRGCGSWPVNQPDGPHKLCSLCGERGEPEKKEEPMAKKCTDEFAAELRRMVDDMLAIDHRTVWLDSDHDTSIVFMSFHPPTVKKAKRALREAGVLCPVVLGHAPKMDVSEDTDDQDS
jgi:hypothetical protein